MRLRRGKEQATGGVPSGRIASSRPCSAMAWCVPRSAGWVDLVDAAGQHCDGADLQGGLVVRRSSMPRARPNAIMETPLAQAGGQLGREAKAGERGIARGDDRRGRPGRSAGRHRRSPTAPARGVGHGSERGQVVGIAQHQEPSAGISERLLLRAISPSGVTGRSRRSPPCRAEMLQRFRDCVDRSRCAGCGPAEAGRGARQDRGRSSWVHRT